MNKINVRITGAGGQLAKCLVDVLNKYTDKIEYTALSRKFRFFWLLSSSSLSDTID